MPGARPGSPDDDPAVRAALAAARTRLAPQEDERASEPVRGIAPPRPGQRTAVLVGPGVVRTGNVARLHSFAAASGLSIVNTFGAKGVFRWDDPHHGGTVGLQRDDWELAGLYDADRVIVSGLDFAECRGLRLSGVEMIDVPPSHLDRVAVGWPAPCGPPIRPPLYDALAAVVGRLYEVPGSPPNAARALARGSAEAARSTPTVIVADAGPAGFWIARTFPTSRPGEVVVPATPVPGFATAAAVVAAEAGIRVVAVTTEPLDEVSERLRTPTSSVDVWGSGEPGTDRQPRCVAVDWSHLAALEAVAGPVTAWP